MKRLLIAGVLVAAGLGLFPVQASASTLAQCLAQQHVCVSGSARSLVSAGQEASWNARSARDGIYVVVAPSGSSGYNSAMRPDHQRPQRARPVHGGVPGQPAPALRRLQPGDAARPRRRGDRDPGRSGSTRRTATLTRR